MPQIVLMIAEKLAQKLAARVVMMVVILRVTMVAKINATDVEAHVKRFVVVRVQEHAHKNAPEPVMMLAKAHVAEINAEVHVRTGVKAQVIAKFQQPVKKDAQVIVQEIVIILVLQELAKEVVDQRGVMILARLIVIMLVMEVAAEIVLLVVPIHVEDAAVIVMVIVQDVLVVEEHVKKNAVIHALIVVAQNALKLAKIAVKLIAMILANRQMHLLAQIIYQ